MIENAFDVLGYPTRATVEELDEIPDDAK